MQRIRQPSRFSRKNTPNPAVGGWSVETQALINLLNFLWTTFHDFVYLGAYFLLTHFHILKRSRTADERLAALEEKFKS